MQDFLTLKFLVTPYLIIFVYWLVAIIIPVVALLATLAITSWVIPRLREWLEPMIQESGVLEIDEIQNLRRSVRTYMHEYRWARWVFWGLFVLLLLILELVWRLICEFIMVYYNIHDALVSAAPAAGM